MRWAGAVSSRRERDSGEPQHLIASGEAVVEKDLLRGKSLLITGGTGSFGKKCVETILREHKPRKVVVFSRDELKQYEMAEIFSEREYPCMSYMIGDVRDRNRVYRALHDIDYVIHAAAIKQVPAAEYNPFEAIKTNVLGAENLIEAAIDTGVKKVVALSTDKAANPINLYGATKLCSDKLFIAANHYARWADTRFSVVRYGNVFGSRGSVVPFFQQMRPTGVLPITDPRMTRFWITLDQGVRFVLRSLEVMEGGELFVPKIPSMKVTDLAAAIAPECEQRIIGIRPGEKLHEVLITSDDARHTVEFEDRYVIEPDFPWWSGESYGVRGAVRVPEDFIFASNTNDQWLTPEELREMIGGE
jgi:UDP-N-acetylglucosamine 4,6-dehydratase